MTCRYLLLNVPITFPSNLLATDSQSWTAISAATFLAEERDSYEFCVNSDQFSVQFRTWFYPFSTLCHIGQPSPPHSPMRWSRILSNTDSMSSRLKLLEPTRPFSIPNMPPRVPLVALQAQKATNTHKASRQEVWLINSAAIHTTSHLKFFYLGLVFWVAPSSSELLQSRSWSCPPGPVPRIWRTWVKEEDGIRNTNS